MKRRIGLLTALLFATLAAQPALSAADWQPVPGHLMTDWAARVDPHNVLPEYPRPQLVRGAWVNLNGLWDYAVTSLAAPQPAQFDGRILVPFCIESALSGVQRKFTPQQRLWYHREFTAPPLAPSERLRLNFGAVDYQATVLVNGLDLGTHRGGYDAFSCDITDALRPGANSLVVSVLDPTGGGPSGKQRLGGGDIWYTPTSGIWQTVWLETVPENYITGLKLVPDIDQGTLTVVVQGREGTAKVSVLDGGARVAGGEAKVGEPLVLKLQNAKLWSPESPFLYDLEVTLGRDVVRSYAGLRKIGKGPDAQGRLRPLLNNRPIFMAGPLDQGFWPDGLYTAPTDDALRFDLEMTKRFGFNLTRKHIKVEPARWYYWADKLGLLVWQDMPCGWGSGKGADGARDGVAQSADAARQFELELRAMVEQHANSPAVILWVVFNEAWGQFDTPRLTRLVKDLDPTRLVTGGSGWFRAPCGDVVDVHHYQEPARTAPEADRIGVCGEFGGLGYVIPGHLWFPAQRESSVYVTCADQLDFEKQFLALWREAFAGDRQNGTSAAVYTELTDIEGEVNGLLTYDRKVVKANVELFRRALAQREFPPQPTVKMLVPTSERQPQEWSYTVAQPGEDWFKPGAERAGWQRGKAVFGFTDNKWGMAMSTAWHSPEIWLARTFILPPEPVKRPLLRIAYARRATVYLNGVKALEQKGGYLMRYVDIPLPAAAAACLKAGENTIAIHADKPVAEKPDNQFIDVGLGDETIPWQAAEQPRR